MTGDRSAPTGRSELSTRFVIGPAMLAVVAASYWIDSTWLAERGHGGWLTAGLLGVLGIAGIHEFATMMLGSGIVALVGSFWFPIEAAIEGLEGRQHSGVVSREQG